MACHSFPPHTEKKPKPKPKPSHGHMSCTRALFPAFYIASLGSAAPHPLPYPCWSSLFVSLSLIAIALVLELFHFLSEILLPWNPTSLLPSCSCQNVTSLVRTSLSTYLVFHYTPTPHSGLIFDICKKKNYHHLNYYMYLCAHCLFLFELECSFPKTRVFCSLLHSKCYSDAQYYIHTVSICWINEWINK